MTAETEQIVLVDETGQPIGHAEKLASHHAGTPLHLAFSCYVFNHKGEFLVTQRATSKKVWPSVWTNSCCGHPGPRELVEDAVKRRLDYELGMSATDISLLVADYTYKTTPYNGIIEHEFCPIYIARSATSQVQPNPDEVGAYKWVDWQEYVGQISADDTDAWSWWCKDQLRYLQKHPLITLFSKPV